MTSRKSYFILTAFWVLLLFCQCTRIVPICFDEMISFEGTTIKADGRWYYTHPKLILFTDVIVSIEKENNQPVNNLIPVMTTLYYYGTDEPAATFFLDGDTVDISSPGIYQYTFHCVEGVESNISPGTILFGCIEVQWDNGGGALATPPSEVTVVY